MTTPSFRDIATEAVEAEPTTETPEVQPSTTVEPKEETQEEVFAEKGELAGKTPEQLEETYKNWQRAYTEKRQKETQQLKELQVKLEQLEKQTVQQPQQAPVEQRAQEAQQALDLGQMSVSQYTEYMKNLAAEQAREVAREEYQAIMAEERETQLADKALEQFETADSRLNPHSPEFKEGFRNEVQRELAELLDHHLEEHKSYKEFDAATLTKQIIERRDKELDEVIKLRTQQSTQAAKMREAKARKSEVRGSTSNGQSIGGSSIRDILSETLDSAA